MKLKQFLKYVLLTIFGGLSYVLIEIIWRGYSNPSMFILGGLSFLIVGLLNEIFSWKIPIEIQSICGGAIITIMELIAGIILNIILKLNVWNYSLIPLNFLGQICLPFSLLWIVLSFLIIIIDDWIRYKFFGEEKPHYYSLIVEIIKKLKRGDKNG